MRRMYPSHRFTFNTQSTHQNMKRGATFSECGNYRYVLWRIWDESKPMAMCVGLNPSTANGEKDDHTIRLLIKYIGELGFGGFRMMNLYALIDSKPEALSACPDPVKENDKYLQLIAEDSDEIIFCWGQFKQAEWRAKKVKAMFPNSKCFMKSKSGTPVHPRKLGYIKDYKPELIDF